MFTTTQSVIDSNSFIKFKLGNIGNLQVERIDKKHIKIHFFHQDDTPMNIIREYPDKFWEKEIQANRFTKTITQLYNLENGLGAELCHQFQQDVNAKGGVPTLDEINAVFNNDIRFTDDYNHEITVDPEEKCLKLIKPSEIPKAVRKIFENFENMSSMSQMSTLSNSSDNQNIAERSSDNNDVIDVHHISIPNSGEKKIKNKKKEKKLLCVYKVRYGKIVDIYDMLPKSVTLRMDTSPLDELKIITLDMGTFFKYNQKLKIHEKCADSTADFIMNKLNIITLDDTDEMYFYEDGIYKPKAHKRIREFCDVIFLDRTSRFKDEVVKQIADRTYVKRSDLEYKNLICLKNGILDINTLKVIPHTPKYYFINKLPVNYDPKATCPTFDEFLTQVLYIDDIPCVEETIGYTLYKEYKFHKAFMFYGEGRNGKSTLINVITHFLGQDNVASQSLHDLVTDRFSKANLYGKYANLFADIPQQALHETDVFKTLTGNDYFSAQHKFQHPFDMRNYAKLIFSANKIPETYDKTDAFYGRWVMIKFPYQFYGNSADEHLLDKLTTDEELSGILNLALRGLRRLLDNGDFSNTKSIEDIKVDYNKTSDSTRAFCDDDIKEDPAGRIPKDDLYVAYRKYCIKNKLTILSMVAFGKKVMEIFPGITDGRPTIDGERKRSWFGISLKEKDELDGI